MENEEKKEVKNHPSKHPEENLPPAPNLVKGSKSSLLRISHQQLLSQCLVEELD